MILKKLKNKKKLMVKNGKYYKAKFKKMSDSKISHEKSMTLSKS